MHTAEPPPSPRRGAWLAEPCEEELRLSRPPEAMYLPGGHPHDTVLHGEPPLPIDLDDDHVADLRAARHGGLSSVAATSYGPRPQDKLVNEDFALSAVLHSSDAEDVPRWSFAVVADGVSNETFYSARTARLSCLVAFKTCRRMTRKRSGCGDDDALEGLAEALAADLRDAFQADRELLIRERCTPDGWDPSVYQANAGNDRRWYASTLLVAALGAESDWRAALPAAPAAPAAPTPKGVRAPSGCPSAGVCPLQNASCFKELPPLLEVAPGHWLRCPPACELPPPQFIDT